MVGFAKHQRKDDITRQYLREFDADEGVLDVGRAQEKAGMVRNERRRSATTGMTYPVGARGLGDGQPQLLLLRGPRLRPLFSEVLFVLSAQRQAVHQWQ